MLKISKAAAYIKMRAHELSLSFKEFRRCAKASPLARQKYSDSWKLVTAHSIEKGLGLPDASPGHSGHIVLQLLDKLLSEATKCSDSFAFMESFSVIAAYMNFQQQYDTKSFPKYRTILEKYEKLISIVGKDYEEDAVKTCRAGYTLYKKEDLLPSMDLDHFIGNRHSVREYAPDPVKTEDIKRCVKTALMAPSACNRQPSKVYFTCRSDMVRKIDDLITGSSGFKGQVPNYIVITTDRAAFSNEEMYQWYINGGIFTAYLSLALHNIGIGHCIMQWKAFYKTEKELKDLLGIPDTEAIIATIGCGYYKDKTACLESQRRNADEILRII